MKRIPEWSTSLKTFSIHIDYLHQALLELARKTIQTCEETGLDSDNFHDNLNRLATTANELFAVEEAALLERQDPTLTQHQADHNRLREEITELLYMASIGRKIDCEGLCLVLVDWAVRHLTDYDEIFRTPRIT